MKPSVELIPIFDDNYVFLILNAKKNKAIVVDPGDAEATLKILETRKIDLSAILITHHHHDHIDGLADFKKHFNGAIYAPLKNKNQIQLATHFVQQGDQLQIDEFKIDVLELPGHTLGHVAYSFLQQLWLFSGDVLFGLGCGRLFEGTPAQMFESLQTIKKLSAQTQIFCTHEYTQTNLNFCRSLPSLDQDILNQYEQAKGLPSVPLTLAAEMRANPFLRAESLSIFTELRRLRNHF